MCFCRHVLSVQDLECRKIGLLAIGATGKTCLLCKTEGKSSMLYVATRKQSIFALCFFLQGWVLNRVLYK